MIGPRIVWALCLIGSLAFLLFSTSWVSLLLLVVVVAVPVLLLVVNRLTASKLAISLGLPKAGEKNVALNGQLQVNNQSIVPHAPLWGSMRCENLLTGELLTKKLMFSAGAKSEELVTFELRDQFCGTLSICLEQAKAYDPFGLWAAKLAQTPRATVCVLPQTFAPHIVVQQNLSQNIEADEYAQDRPGSDPSDTFAIREYRPGDRLNRMHWKLTWKFDEMMIREPSMPVQHSFLVVLETILESDMQSPTPQVLDAKMEILISVCQALVEEEIIFDLAWFDHDEQMIVIKQISDVADLSGLLSKLLSAKNRPHEYSTMALLAEKMEAASYEHVLYVSQSLHSDLCRLAGSARATALVCSDNHDFSFVNEGTLATYYCTPNNYEHELAYLEI